MLQIQQVFEFLRDNAYILSTGDQFVFAKKFYQEIDRKKKTVMSVKDIPTLGVMMIPQAQIPAQIAKGIDWKMYFIKFIVEAKVPDKCEGAHAELYDTNKYSDDAMKAFRKMIETEKIDYNVLVKSTMLYYKGGRFRKKISNYIIDGDWRSDYLNLANAAEQGEEHLKDHIKKNIDNGEHNQWSY